MSDIVKRLRRVMREQFYRLPIVSRTCEDAANEIERLRQENEELRAADRDHLAAKNGMEKRLVDDVERLKRALGE